MGSNQFQREHIEYLEKRNTELLNKFNHMKESYESKILSRDLSKHYLISTLEEALNVCTVIPQELDMFFDKMTAAMGALENILLRKAEMIHLVEKISRVLTSTQNSNLNLFKAHDPGEVNEQVFESRGGKKGTVKVSPMINGHIISTEPRIYLSRVPGVCTPERRVGTHQLSPIIEASPDTSSDPSNMGSQIYKEIKIPLERINLNKMSYNYISEGSPKSRFKGPKRWKKSLSSHKNNQIQRSTVFLETNENFNKNLSVEEELSQPSERLDPLEGPSWLYEENPEMNSSSNRFVDFRRRKHRFATVFDKDEDCLDYFEKSKKSLKEDLADFYENQEEKDDEEDLDESRKRISESSEDFICESFSNGWGEKYSPTEKKRRSSKGKMSNALSDKNCSSEFDKDFIKETSSPYLKNSNKNTPIDSDSTDEEYNEENSGRKPSKSRKSFRKRPSKLSCRKLSDLWNSNEKTPRTSSFGESKVRISNTSKGSTSKNKLIREALENNVFVKLEDCMMGNKSISKKSLTTKKYKKSKSKSKSRSPVVVFPEKEGRVRRKAAPTFKLVEPKLGTKLRRE